jgi:hypothetical protein
MLRKSFHLISILLLVGLLVALSVSSAAAQSSLPTVTIKATDPIAKEPNDKGQFTVYRSTSSTSLAALTVYYMVSGTATNGVDYVSLTGTVTIPAGALSAPISIVPRDDSLRELPETVIVTIVDPCVGPVPCIYNIGTSNSATVTIYDND